MGGTTLNSKEIKASPEKLYKAFTTPEALAIWQAPGNMTAKVHRFDLRVGGGYEMSLFYPATDVSSQGKTGDKEDKFSSHFLELVPNEKIVQAIHFDSSDPSFSGEMIMEVTLKAKGDSTIVTFLFNNIPSGIKPEDNEEGTKSSLEKLARYVESAL
jgi:uncharacterized protein YndB with AHSA1/START domain